MFKKLIVGILATLFFALQLSVGNAAALELDQESRTVKLNEQGDTLVLSLKELKQGQRLFVDTCSKCHNGGRTKTNPNVTLGGDDLAGAEPARDNILGMVDYLKNPTTYDGEVSMLELHPNTTRTDLYPEMRNFTDDDLKAVSGYILIQPKIRGIKWGTGKTVN